MAEEDSIKKFDHGLDSRNAQHYNYVKKLEQDFLDGKIQKSSPDPSPTPTEIVANPVLAVPNSDEDTVIKFVPKKLPIEFSFSVEGDKKIKVKVIALQVSETDEAVTVLLDKSVEFTFPVLFPFYITLQDGIVHKVCYAGGTCQIGPCKFISFIKTQ